MRLSGSCVAITAISFASYTRGFTGFQLQCRSKDQANIPHKDPIHASQFASFRHGIYVNSPLLYSASIPEEEYTSGSKRSQKKISYISRISSSNLAGLKGYESEEIVLNLSVDAQDYSNLVVVTGETGSGKSLLVSKVAELITGGKATPALLNAPKGTSSVDSRATVEMGRSYRYEEYVFVDATVSHAFLVLHGRLLCSSGTG
jgi:hypothetical protein